MLVPNERTFRVLLSTALRLGLLIAVLSVPLRAQGDESWTIRSEPHFSLWFHGLAVIGYGTEGPMPVYNPAYAAYIAGVKEESGTHPTELDNAVEELSDELRSSPAFQFLHFLPFYFPDARLDEMLGALKGFADQDFDQPVMRGGNVRAGIRTVAANFQDKSDRRVLGEYVAALQQEWDSFYRDYWRQTATERTARNEMLQDRWDDLSPAFGGFMRSVNLSGGDIYIAQPLGPDGRLFQNRTLRGEVQRAVGVWAPHGWDDQNVSLYGVVREMCFSISDRVVQAAGGGGPPDEGGRVAVQCGAMLFEHNAPELLGSYQETYVRVAGADTADVPVAAAFADAYAVDEVILGDLRRRIEATASPGEVTASFDPTWQVVPRAQIDLWFHALAVVQADQPGPLGLYSAEYATMVRQVKQEMGIYPTLLDSLAEEFREAMEDNSQLDDMHFVPLFFPRATPERMLNALRAVSKKKTNGEAVSGADVRPGAVQMSLRLTKGDSRRFLEDLVDAVELEWDEFYKDYWERQREAEKGRYEAIQAMWDTIFGQQLSPYLEARRLSAGLVAPSPPLGPEGRIVEFDSFNPQDQVVAVQMPISAEGPETSVFAFLKELCFLVIDNNALAPYAIDAEDLEDLRRRAAVRCGALILDFYAPTMSARYRRVFLDAVGAEESYTVGAFERVYVLEPRVAELLREQIRRRR